MNQYIEGRKIDKKTLNWRLVIRIKPLDWMCGAIKFGLGLVRKIV